MHHKPYLGSKIPDAQRQSRRCDALRSIFSPSPPTSAPRRLIIQSSRCNLFAVGFSPHGLDGYLKWKGCAEQHWLQAPHRVDEEGQPAHDSGALDEHSRNGMKGAWHIGYCNASPGRRNSKVFALALNRSNHLPVPTLDR